MNEWLVNKLELVKGEAEVIIWRQYPRIFWVWRLFMQHPRQLLWAWGYLCSILGIFCEFGLTFAASSVSLGLPLKHLQWAWGLSMQHHRHFLWVWVCMCSIFCESGSAFEAFSVSLGTINVASSASSASLGLPLQHFQRVWAISVASSVSRDVLP